MISQPNIVKVPSNPNQQCITQTQTLSTTGIINTTSTLPNMQINATQARPTCITTGVTQTQNCLTEVVKVPMNIPLACGVGNLPIAVVNTNMLQGAPGLGANVIPEGNPPGGLILLNIGDGGNHLAAAINQLVNAGNLQSATNLIQPPTVTSSLAMTSSHIPVTATTVPVPSPVMSSTIQNTTAHTYLHQQIQAQQPQNGTFGFQTQNTVPTANPAAYVLVPLQGATNQMTLPTFQSNNTNTTGTNVVQATNGQIPQKPIAMNHTISNSNIHMMQQVNNSAFVGQPHGYGQVIPSVGDVQTQNQIGNMQTSQPVLTTENLCNFIKSSTNLALSNSVNQSESSQSLPTIFLPEFSNPTCSTSSTTAQNINTVVTMSETQSMNFTAVQNANHKPILTSGLDFLAHACSDTSHKPIPQHLNQQDHVELNNNHGGDIPIHANQEKVLQTTSMITSHDLQQPSNKSNLFTDDLVLGAPEVKKQKKTEDTGFSGNQFVSENGRERKKKGPAPKLTGNETCSICGLKASGFHYNVLSCEGCKGFFRRSIIKNAIINYRCKQDGNCSIDMQLRRKCQFCRYNKCLSVGMRVDCVLSEDKVKLKKLKREIIEKPFTYPGQNIESLTPKQLNMLEVLRQNVRRFEWPTADDVQKVTTWNENDDPNRVRAARFAHFTELAILIVQLVVEFTKQLPGFLTVERSDQIVLLKASAIEVMLLRAAKQYNKHDGTISFLNEHMYDKTSFYNAGIQTAFVEPIFAFCESMARLNLDDAEYAMLVAINTFSSDRPHITNINLVEKMQDPYIDLLRVYCKIHRPDDPLMFARILMKLVELRTLNNCHSEQMFSLKLQDKRLPPLLAEIWDM